VKPTERTVSISRRDKRELCGLAQRDAEAEHRHERHERPDAVGGPEHRCNDRGLRQRHNDEEPAVLETVDDRTGQPGR
jgi:hypothetical protein